jgi:DNA-binding response OmpR family regulator
MSDRYTITLDDDPVVARIIERTTGLKTIGFDSVATLAREAGRYQPIAAFLDVHFDAGECGLDIVPALRAKWPYTPIIVITGDPDDNVVAKALESGADDFILKPLRPKELLARLRVRLDDMFRRQAKTILKVGDVQLDTTTRLLRGPAGDRYLSPTEMSILICLIQAKGTVVSKVRLKRAAWRKLSVSKNAVDRKIFELRRGLHDVSRTTFMRSVYGKGVALSNR